MTRRWWMALGLVIVTAVPLPPAARAAAAPAKPGPRLASVTLGIRHRVFQDFRDLQTVKLRKPFRIGDTDYSAVVMEYVPDFTMELKTHRVVSRSGEPNNPAFKIVVRLKGKAQDTTWAMLKMPPHFSRNSMLGFKVARIDFVGRPPLVNADTSSAPPATEAPRHGAMPGTGK